MNNNEGNTMNIYNPPARGMYTVKVIQHGEHPYLWSKVLQWLNALGHWIEESGYRAATPTRNAMHRIQAVAIGADWFALDIANAWKVEAWAQLEKISGFGLRTVIPWENGQTRLQFYRA